MKDWGLNLINENNIIYLRLNWFWIDFHPQDKKDLPKFQKEANLDNKGAGLFLYISVENVDDFYKGLVSKGLKPSSRPQDLGIISGDGWRREKLLPSVSLHFTYVPTVGISIFSPITCPPADFTFFIASSIFSTEMTQE